VIYFTQDKQTKAIKIGYSKNPIKRRASLQSSTPGELVLLGTIHGGLEHERGLHDDFAEYRVHGEWFKGEILPEVMEIIARYPADGPPPSNVIIVGDSDFHDEGLVYYVLDEMHARNQIAWIITGGRRWLERWAWSWADKNKVKVHYISPKLGNHGKFAPFKVGPQMLRSMFDPKTVVAFLEGKANSSALSLIKQAQKAKIEVVVKGKYPEGMGWLGRA
jgi:hypothetical protein